jgi:putative ABC transport system permease protein
MGQATCSRLKLQPRERFVLNVGGRLQQVSLLDYLRAGQQPSAALDNLMVADIATAQLLLNMTGRLSWIDLKLPSGASGRQQALRIKSILPAAAKLERAEARGESMSRLTRAFMINLTAMSLLALLVGMFLIYSTMTLSVLQRRSFIGNIRALGVTRTQVFSLVLLEALGLSMVAVLIGIPSGLALAQGLVGMVTRTINDLYFTLGVNQLFIDPVSLAKGAALGVGASLVAALGPASEAAGIAPRAAQMRSVLEARIRRLVPRLALLGLIVMLAGCGLLMPGRSLLSGFAALFLVALGYAFVVPEAVRMAARMVGWPLARMFGLPARLAARGIEASLSRTGVAVAALVVAVAATAGVDIMIESFRSTVAAWLHSTLRADVYVTVAGANDDSGLDPKLVEQISGQRGIAAISTGRWLEVEVDGHSASLRVVQLAPGRRGFTLKAGEKQAVWSAFDSDQAVLVSEPYAYRHDAQPGDMLQLRTERGQQRFLVAGVFYDYGSQRGVIVMRRDLYEQFWHDRAISSLGIYLRPGHSEQSISQRLREAARGVQHVLIRSNRALREQSLAIFDRTFAVTNVLRLLAVVVAAVGILSALMALQLERARDYAVLRATGFTPGQVGVLAIGETSLLGLISGLLAVPLGIVMSLMLIDVINRRSFGWSMQFLVTPEALLQPLALATVTALLAGLYPALVLARAPPAEALRSE